MCSLGRKMRRAMLYLEHQIDTPVPSAFLHLWGVMCVRSPDIRFIQLIAINIVLKHSSQSKKIDVRICWNYGMQLRACSFLLLGLALSHFLVGPVKKTTVYIYLFTFYENVRRHFIWSQSDRLSAYFYRLDTDTTQMSWNANLELVAIYSKIAHLWQFCENLDAWQKSGEAISPQETLPAALLWCKVKMFFFLQSVIIPLFASSATLKKRRTNNMRQILNSAI